MKPRRARVFTCLKLRLAAVALRRFFSSARSAGDGRLLSWLSPRSSSLNSGARSSVWLKFEASSSSWRTLSLQFCFGTSTRKLLSTTENMSLRICESASSRFMSNCAYRRSLLSRSSRAFT